MICVGLGVLFGASTVRADVPPQLVPHAGSAGSRFGAFAGEFTRPPSPTSISGSWRVPRILPGSHPGFAGTWVGIEGLPTPNEDYGAFVQVGVNEERATEFGRTRNFYWAFFSDTKLDFSPKNLFPVQPGDLIRASLVLRDHRWYVRIHDASSGAGADFFTTQNAAGSFNQAEWLQEDVTNGRTQQPFPYPKLSTVRFSDLRVNGVEPNPSVMFSQWMSENGGQLGPGAVTGDAFSLSPQTISPLARQFFAITAPTADVDDWFVNQLLEWTPSTPAVETAAERSAYSQAVAQEVSALQAATWPSAAAPLIAELIAQRQSVIAYLQTQPGATQASITQWIDGLYALGSDDPGLVALAQLVGAPSG